MIRDTWRDIGGAPNAVENMNFLLPLLPAVSNQSGGRPSAGHSTFFQNVLPRFSPARLLYFTQRTRNAYTLTIMTSVDFTSAAALSPRLRRISRAASAVMREVMCCPPMESFTCASSPSMRTSTMRPTS